MKIIYSRTRHLGNHETETLTVEEIDIYDNPALIFNRLKKFVDEQMEPHQPTSHLVKGIFDE